MFPHPRPLAYPPGCPHPTCNDVFPIGPRSRSDGLEPRPYAFNAGGVKEVQDRAVAQTSSAELEANGGGTKFPLYFQPRADNGNYLVRWCVDGGVLVTVICVPGKHAM